MKRPFTRPPSFPSSGPGALEKLNAASDTAGTAMVCLNERGIHMVTTPNMDEIGRRFVDENWMERNSRGRAAFEGGFVGIPRFATGEELFAPGQHLTDPMTNELFRPYGFGYVAGFIVQLPHGDTIIMNVEQYWAKGPVNAASLQTLDSLYPHLARGMLVAGRADFERTRTAVDTLAALAIPAVALSPTGRVVLANGQFEASDHVWRTRAGDKLALRDRVADGMLQQALATLSSSAGPRSIPVRSSPGGAVTSVLQIAPVRRTAHDVFGSALAIVILSEPKAGAPDATLIQSLFGLTPAEIALAQSIAAGQSVNDIARTTKRSISTIRNQLRSVMLKTGSTRQVELVLLMRQLGKSPS